MKKFPWFLLLLLAVITGLTVMVVPVVTSLSLGGEDERVTFQTYITSPLERIALEEAKQQDPSYQWIDIVDEDVPDAVAEYIRSAVNNENQSFYNYFASDSNLSWIMTTSQGTFRHNWKNEYKMDGDSTLDMSITTSADDAVSIRTNLNAETSDQLFNTMCYITVPETLVPNERLQSQGNEYAYVLHLPDYYSIQFHIPSRIEPNGGRIAAMIYDISDSSGFLICLGGSTLVIALLVLLVNKNLERNTPIFKQIVSMKALPAWILLGVLLAAALNGVPLLSGYIATGSLRNTLYTEGFSSLQLRWLMPAAAYGSWFALLFIISMVCLYVKYIIAFGIARYLKEDTVISAFFIRSTRRVEDASRIEFGNWTWRKVWPVILEGALFVLTTCMITGGLFGLPMMILVFLGELGAVLIIARRMLYLLQKNYQVTLKTAKDMAMNQLEIPPRQVGTFQPLYDSLINISQGFQIALKDAITSQNMKTQLISNVSHDLKTPVTGIKTYAELISQTDDLKAIHEYSRRLDNYTERLTSLIQDLFDVARATSGDIQLDPVRINLTELVEQVLVDWTEDLEAKNLSIVTHLIPNALVEVDAEKIVRVIENLLGNLRKYALQGTRVFVTLQDTGDQFLLTFKNVSSTPLDFNPEEITERFTRGDRSRHQTGSGLGLAIVKSFMEVHGGTCTIEVDGDVFKCLLRFPKAEEPVEEASEREEILPEQEIEEPAEETESASGPESEFAADSYTEEVQTAELPNILIGVSSVQENPDEAGEEKIQPAQPGPGAVIHPEIPIDALLEAGLPITPEEKTQAFLDEGELPKTSH